MTNVDSIEYKPTSKREYIDRYADKEVFRGLNKGAVIAYICTGISLVASIYTYSILKDSTFLYMLIDPIIMLALTLGAHLKKSKICAIIFTIIAGLEIVAGFIFSQKLVGILPFIAGIIMLRAFKQIDEKYNVFLKEQKYAFEMK